MRGKRHDGCCPNFRGNELCVEFFERGPKCENGRDDIFKHPRTHTCSPDRGKRKKAFSVFLVLGIFTLSDNTHALVRTHLHRIPQTHEDRASRRIIIMRVLFLHERSRSIDSLAPSRSPAFRGAVRRQQKCCPSRLFPRARPQQFLRFPFEASGSQCRRERCKGR